MTIVMKFGGTSVGDGEKVKAAAALVAKAASSEGVVVVVSAMSGVTDSLLSVAASAHDMKDDEIDSFVSGIRKRHEDAATASSGKDLGKVLSAIEKRSEELKDAIENIRDTGLNDHFRDRVAAFGEKFSAALLSGAISEHVPSDWHHGDNGLIVVDDNFLSPEPDMEATEDEIRKRILPQVENGTVPVITGYMGCTHQGHTTTLGRGSSDQIASIVGACVGAREVQIWTDVDGLLTADPKVVPGSRLIPKVSFGEASELAYFGAKVLHPKTILPAMQKNIPIRILNTHNPSSPGTMIVSGAERSKEIVKAITSKSGVTMVDIVSTKMLAAHGFLAKVFEIFGRHGISIDMISTTEVSVSMTIDSRINGRMEPVLRELRDISQVNLLENRAVICIVGDGMKMVSGTAGRVFSCLGKSGINVECISQGASEINIGLVVEERDAANAVRALHQEFFPGDG